ncbi:MAG: hypothetical protein WB623_25990, partial [Candidatus Sulfotelmatobacter sp.]
MKFVVSAKPIFISVGSATARAPFLIDTLGPHTSCFFLLPHCGLPDGLYYLCLTDSLIRRDQRHAFDN